MLRKPVLCCPVVAPVVLEKLCCRDFLVTCTQVRGSAKLVNNRCQAAAMAVQSESHARFEWTIPFERLE